MKLLTLLSTLSSLFIAIEAFNLKPSAFKSIEKQRVPLTFAEVVVSEPEHEIVNEIQFEKITNFATAGIVTLLASPLSALAKDGAYGILEGRTASLLHPITMFTLFLTTLYSGYLGLNIKRLRDIGDELKAMNAQLPKISSGSVSFPIEENLIKIDKEIATLSSATDEISTEKSKKLLADKKLLQPFLELDDTYSELASKRKELVGMNLKDKHHSTGSILLGVGVTVSILGAFNTFMRTGKLFPGPHLYAGMAVTILWAVAASLVPAMQKGDKNARAAHIVLNTLNVLLFASQLPTGLEITLKVLEFTKFP